MSDFHREAIPANIPTEDLMRIAKQRQYDEDPIVMMARQMGGDHMIPEAGMVYAGKGYMKRESENGAWTFHWNEETQQKMDAAKREAEMPFWRWLLWMVFGWGSP